jgi:carbon storage regulator
LLVLSRKVGEQIQIGDDILLTVVSVEGNKVRLGIQAPRSARILRGELVARPEIHPAESCMVVDVAPDPANG